jgi:uncharacterized protein (TIGR02145 family)
MRIIITTLLLAVCAVIPLRAQWQPGEPITDARDGQTYSTVVIGSQVWMAENLNIGTVIASNGPGALMKDNGIIEKYCWDDAQGNCDGDNGMMKRGGFYEWEEAVQYWQGQPALPVQGICPDGWHIPSNAEWNTLLNYLGGATAYTPMLDGGASGFDALLTGYRCTMNGGFRASAMSADTRTYFWTSEQTDAGNAPFVEIGQQSLQAFAFQKSIGLCVRCIMNDAATGIGDLMRPAQLDINAMHVAPGGLLSVSFSAPAPEVDMLVVDMLGRSVHRSVAATAAGSATHIIDLQGAPAGSYLLRISSGRQSATKLFQVY